MSTSKEHNWEDHWRKEMQGHAPLASAEDWRGMAQQLKQGSPSHVQHLIEQEPASPMPWLINKSSLPQFGWEVWTGILLLVIAFGCWLGSFHGEIVHQEMNVIRMAHDTFPPHYALDRYWTYDKEGNRIGAMHSDTIWMDYTVRKRGVYALLSPGKVADYRIDTVFRVTGRGELLSSRQDTVYDNRPRPRQSPGFNGHNRGRAVYRYDTIYQLDTLGNLTGRIHRIDTTISYLPLGVI